MANDNLAYLVVVLCSIAILFLVKYTRGDMARGVRRIRKWCHI